MQAQDGTGRLPSCPKWCAEVHKDPSALYQMHESLHGAATQGIGSDLLHVWSAVEQYEGPCAPRASQVFVSAYDGGSEISIPRVYAADAREARGWGQVLRVLGRMTQADHDAVADALDRAAVQMEAE